MVSFSGGGKKTATWLLLCAVKFRIFPYSVGLMYSQYQILKSTDAGSVWFWYTRQKNSSQRHGYYIQLCFCGCVYYSPMLRASNISFGISPNSTLLPTAYSICILQASQLPLTDHIFWASGFSSCFYRMWVPWKRKIFHLWKIWKST